MIDAGSRILYKAIRSDCSTSSIVTNGFDEIGFPEPGAYLSDSVEVVSGYSQHYRNGVVEFRIATGDFDWMLQQDLITIDLCEVDSWIVRPSGYAMFNRESARRLIDPDGEEYYELFGAP